MERLLQSLESLDTLPEDRGHELVSELAGFGAAAVEPLTNGTRQLSHTGWHLAHEVVGSVTDPRAIPLLVRLITEPEVDLLTADAAKTALLGIGAPSLPALLALEHSSHGLQLHVCEIVVGVDDPRCIPRLVTWLNETLSTEDAPPPTGLLWALGRFGALHEFAPALQHSSAHVRIAAIDAVPTNHPQTADALIPMLSDSEAAVRQRAAIGLMKNGRPTSLPALTVCLRDPSKLIRQAARNAIGVIRSTQDNASD